MSVFQKSFSKFPNNLFVHCHSIRTLYQLYLRLPRSVLSFLPPPSFCPAPFLLLLLLLLPSSSLFDFLKGYSQGISASLHIGEWKQQQKREEDVGQRLKLEIKMKKGRNAEADFSLSEAAGVPWMQQAFFFFVSLRFISEVFMFQWMMKSMIRKWRRVLKRAAQWSEVFLSDSFSASAFNGAAFWFFFFVKNTFHQILSFSFFGMFYHFISIFMMQNLFVTQTESRSLHKLRIYCREKDD